MHLYEKETSTEPFPYEFLKEHLIYRTRPEDCVCSYDKKGKQASSKKAVSYSITTQNVKGPFKNLLVI